jgi:hypothetical protein
MMCDIDAILDDFEEAWTQSEPPCFEEFESRLPEEGYQSAVSDLIQIDLEHRWKWPDAGLRMTLTDYLQRCRFPVSETTQTGVLCREYGIRNRWGDCISRREICRKYPSLESGFLRDVEGEIRDIARWPQISLMSTGKLLAQVPLDRAILAGRAQNNKEQPYTVETSPFAHRLHLCDMMDASLSRNQITVTLVTPGIIRIANSSRNRALSVRGRGPLSPGSEFTVELKRTVAISLGSGRYLMIEPAAT